MAYEVKLKEEFGSSFVPFDVSQKECFEPSNEFSEEWKLEEGDDRIIKNIFWSSERQSIIYRLIVDENTAGNSADIDLETLLEKGIIEKYFPIHTPTSKKKLLNGWVKSIRTWRSIDRVKNYFGEEVALFFSYLEFSTMFYLIATVLGIPMFALWKVYGSGWYITVYSIFLAIWSSIFLNFWKRRQSSLNFRWNMTNWISREPTRPSFVGKERKGFEQNGIWISLESEGNQDEKLGWQNNFISVSSNKYFSPAIRKFRMVLSIIPMAIIGLIVVMITMAILSFRLWLQNQSVRNYGTYIGAAVNSVTIIILNTIYDKIAVALTNWENHRTQSHYDNWLVIKLFLFQFVNSYTSLFYIAFFKNGTELWGSDQLQDRCQEGSALNPLSGGCFNELYIQLAFFLGISTAANQFSNTFLPWFLANWKRILCFCCTWENRNKELPIWEEESHLAPDEGDIFKYNQLIIQFGYVVIFGAAFPLAPLIALFNNLINLKVYPLQMLLLNNRPNRRGANDIGVWYWILEFLGIVAVITNCALLGFTHPIIYDYVGGNAFKVLGIIVIMEHIIILIKILVEMWIPDTPHKIRVEAIKQDWIERNVFDRMDAENRKKLTTNREALNMRKQLNDKANERMSFKQESPRLEPRM
eukprot:TRINITY_DN6748_c0_g1_i1.p1 TRINITY_DN6748_c0_g1~~TRINITY_DN6748_c0_g1_i1.p1  ORF type:complete len:641 (+),score=171.42 TRINITY_DN6748_c0_g1_i1:268-2190(+)